MTVTTFLGDEKPAATAGVCRAPGRDGHPRRGDLGPLSGHGRRLPHHGAGRQRHRCRRGDVLLLEPASSPQSNGLAGEVPTLIYSARERKVHALERHGLVAASLHHRLVPRTRHRPDSRRRLSASLRARRGRHLGGGPGALRDHELRRHPPTRYRAGRRTATPSTRGCTTPWRATKPSTPSIYPSTGEVYLPSGEAPEVGALHRNPAWAETLRILCRAEQAAAGRGRVAGIEAARDAFYKGEIAERIIDFITAKPG